MSWSRFLAILIKEIRQVRRDRLTFGMMIGVPIIQLLLFGFAINGDPKHLPAALVMATRASFRAALSRAWRTRNTFTSPTGCKARPKATRCWPPARCSSCWWCRRTSRAS